ncbi:MAG: hypothetical protein WCQ16_03280 [Verrucomicrobiae bacterium]
MKNLELLEYCKQNPEPFFDSYYSKNAQKLIISRDKDAPNSLQKANALVRRNITALEALSGKGEQEAELKLAAEIVDALTTTGINYSEFTSYWAVNDVSFSIYRQLRAEDRIRFVLEMAKSYIKSRHTLYSTHGYSDATLQVQADSFAHKRNGGQGQEKVLKMLREFQIIPYQGTDLEGFENSNNTVILPDSDARALFGSFLSRRKLSFRWGPSHENKRPDFLINTKRQFWIVEHKHMKEFGGGQNKQITEIIDFLAQAEECQDVHYVSFLDGILFNRIFLDKGDEKAKTQRSSIMEKLGMYPGNYFINTAGFRYLMSPRDSNLMTPTASEDMAEYRLRGASSGTCT